MIHKVFFWVFYLGVMFSYGIAGYSLYHIWVDPLQFSYWEALVVSAVSIYAWGLGVDAAYANIQQEKYDV